MTINVLCPKCGNKMKNSGVLVERMTKFVCEDCNESKLIFVGSHGIRLTTNGCIRIDTRHNITRD